MLQFLHFSRTHEQFVHTELTRNWNNEIHLVTLHHYKGLFFNNENIISTHPVTIQYPESFNDGTSLPMIYFIYTSIVTRRITKQSYLGYKTATVHLSTSSLVSILRSIQAPLVIPPSHPWLTRCWSGLWRRVLAQVIRDLRLHSNKYLFGFGQKSFSIVAIRLLERGRNRGIVLSHTGLELTASGAFSWPVSHFHKSGFSWRIKQL
jgi:hypothetical protein